MFKKGKISFFSLMLSFVALVLISAPSIFRILSRKYMGFSRYMVVKNRYLDEVLPMNIISILIALIVVAGIVFCLYYYREFKKLQNDDGDTYKTYVSDRLSIFGQILVGVAVILNVFTQNTEDSKTFYLEVLSYLLVYIIISIANIKNFRIKK